MSNEGEKQLCFCNNTPLSVHLLSVILTWVAGVTKGLQMSVSMAAAKNPD